MAVFGKKTDGSGGDETADYLRIPSGTRFSTSADGKIVLSFGGDMFFGESLPDIGELQCGHNLEIDSGVTLRADVVKVQGRLNLDSGSKLLARRVEVDTLNAEKAHIEVKDIAARSAEFHDSDVTADTVTAREGVVADRGELEIGTVRAKTLNVAKGTISHIQVSHVAKVDGQVSQGGYKSYEDMLTKLFIYHPEILNDETRATAQRLVDDNTGRLKGLRELVQQIGSTGAPASTPSEELSKDASQGAAGGASTDTSSGPLPARLAEQADKLKAFYVDREPPKEIQELLGYVDTNNIADLRRKLNPIYQRLAAQGRIPDPVMEAFLELQRVLKEDARSKKEANPAA